METQNRYEKRHANETMVKLGLAALATGAFIAVRFPVKAAFATHLIESGVELPVCSGCWAIRA